MDTAKLHLSLKKLSDARTLARLAVHLVEGRLIVNGHTRPGFPERSMDWSRRMLTLLGVEVQLHRPDETLLPDALYVSNHGSWVDTLAISSLIPCGFIATAALQSWPIVGTLIRRTGGIFVNGVQTRELEAAIEAVTCRLRTGRSTCVFPEASTSIDQAIRPFGAALFQSAIDAKRPVIPVGLRYRKGGKTTDQLRWSTNEPIANSIRRVKRAAPTMVELHVGRAIEPKGFSRHELAAQARSEIGKLAAQPLVHAQLAPLASLDGAARDIHDLVLRAVHSVAARTVTGSSRLGEIGLDSLSGLGLVLELQRELDIPLTEELLISLQPDVSIADLSVSLAAIKTHLRDANRSGQPASGAVA